MSRDYIRRLRCVVETPGSVRRVEVGRGNEMLKLNDVRRRVNRSWLSTGLHGWNSRKELVHAQMYVMLGEATMMGGIERTSERA